MMLNMIFNWDQGKSSMPVSLVLDASGFLTGELSAGGTNSVVPASDGTYIGSIIPGTVVGPGGYAGYLGLGPVPVATTAWNTTSRYDCATGNCYGVNPSGVLPLLYDTASNPNDYTPNTGGAIGGSPIQDGVFKGSSINFDITALVVTAYDSAGIIAPECEVYGGVVDTAYCHGDPPIPVPAAAWLFASGLVGLASTARRQKRDS